MNNVLKHKNKTLVVTGAGGFLGKNLVSRALETGWKVRALVHNNNPYDSEYRKFLSKIIEPLIDKIIPGAKGLDYGSGPGPTLSLMLETALVSLR